MSNPLADLVLGFQDLVAQVPDVVQPVIVALAGAVPFIEGEGSALIGVIGGVHPLIAALAAVTGNLVSVILVVLLSARIRAAAVGRRERRAASASLATVPSGTRIDGPSAAGAVTLAPSPTTTDAPQRKPESKGRQKLNRWLVRFGVPGASLLAPLALPTQITAATLVASGIGKGRVIFWQAIAIILWTTVTTAGALGLHATLG